MEDDGNGQEPESWKRRHVVCLRTAAAIWTVPLSVGSQCNAMRCDGGDNAGSSDLNSESSRTGANHGATIERVDRIVEKNPSGQLEK
jgi:hypothetical protein